MKIAHVQHPFIPGMGYQENHLPREQLDLGHEVTIITSDFIPEQFRNDPTDSSSVGPGLYYYGDVETHRLESLLRFDAIDDAILRGVTGKLNSFKPDIIHGHNLMSLNTVQACRWAENEGVPIVVDSHIDNGNLNLDSFLKASLYRLYKVTGGRFVRDNSEYFLPVNPHAMEFLECEFNIGRERMRLLPLGVDSKIFSPGGNEECSLAAELGIDDGDTIAITGGNIDETKDLEVLIRSWNDVTETSSDAHLVVFGSGNQGYVDGLRKRVDRFGLRDSVTFLGEVPHEKLPAVYRLADIGIWPGKLGVAILEGMSTGLPIVVCNDLATEFLVENDNGLRFDRGDHDALAEKITRYLSSGDLRVKHANRSRDLVLRKLSWAQIAKDSLSIYDQVIAGDVP